MINLHKTSCFRSSHRMKYLLLFYPEKSGFFSMPCLQFIPEVKLGKIENTVNEKSISLFISEKCFLSCTCFFTRNDILYGS